MAREKKGRSPPPKSVVTLAPKKLAESATPQAFHPLTNCLSQPGQISQSSPADPAA